MAGIKVHFDGKIGKQPELQGEGDKAWVQVGVATERWVGEGKGDVRNYNGQDQTTAYKTTWVNVVAFGRQAQYVAERFSPGDTIVINDGEMEFTTYSKKDNLRSVPCGAQERKQRQQQREWREREPSAGRCARTATGPASGGSSSSGRGAPHTSGSSRSPADTAAAIRPCGCPARAAGPDRRRHPLLRRKRAGW